MPGKLRVHELGEFWLRETGLMATWFENAMRDFVIQVDVDERHLARCRWSAPEELRLGLEGGVGAVGTIRIVCSGCWEARTTRSDLAAGPGVRTERAGRMGERDSAWDLFDIGIVEASPLLDHWRERLGPGPLVHFVAENSWLRIDAVCERVAVPPGIDAPGEGLWWQSSLAGDPGATPGPQGPS
jgi:hypothetical protein